MICLFFERYVYVIYFVWIFHSQAQVTEQTRVLSFPLLHRCRVRILQSRSSSRSRTPQSEQQNGRARSQCDSEEEAIFEQWWGGWSISNETTVDRAHWWMSPLVQQHHPSTHGQSEFLFVSCFSFFDILAIICIFYFFAKQW